MDREEIEDLVHASLGRHLRVTCVLGLLFLAIGFVLGHFVAAQHTRELSDRLASRAERWTIDADRRASQLEDTVKTELAELRAMAQTSREGQKQQGTSLAVPSPVPLSLESTKQSPQTQTEQFSQLLSESKRLARATEELRSTLLTCTTIIPSMEKVGQLAEHSSGTNQPFAVRVEEVSRAVNQLSEAQSSQLRALLAAESSLTKETALLSPTPAEISPISAETQAPHCPKPVELPLIPVADTSANDIEELVELLPMPKHAAPRSPVAAEPSTSIVIPSAASVKNSAALEKMPQHSNAPRKPRVFIPSRKRLANTAGTASTIR